MKHWNKQVLKNWVIKIILIIFKATLIPPLQNTHIHSSSVITSALAVYFSFVDSFPLSPEPTELTGKIFLPKSVNVKNNHMDKTLKTSGKSKVITLRSKAVGMESS